jgi:undecaprenyl-diphosphatase
MASNTTRVFTSLTVTGFILACCAALFLGWLSEEVLEGDTRRFDAFVRAAVHADSSRGFTSAMWFFTDVGSVAGLASLLAATLAILWFVHWRRAVVIMVITMAGAAVLVDALKLGFHRSRPVPYFGITAPSSFSYPSGHALFSFVFFGTLAALVTARIGRLWIRAIIWAASVAMIAAIGYSRIYLGVHYPTDVIGGYLTALIWVWTVSLADRYYSQHRRGAE